MFRQRKRAFLLIIAFLVPLAVHAQDNWDNILYGGNKTVWSIDSWRLNTELQFRLKDNTQALDYWYAEGVASYLPNRYWEIVPDLRFSVYPDRVEIRPGLGVLFKLVWANKHQFVQQLKWQSDLPIFQKDKHGIRYVFFYNYVINPKFFFVSGSGVFFRFSQDFNNLQFIRSFVGIQLNFANEGGISHALSISYLFNVSNLDPNGFQATFSGGPMIIFTFRFRDEWRYTPARYVNF